jgi:hypothetical protein
MRWKYDPEYCGGKDLEENYRCLLGTIPALAWKDGGKPRKPQERYCSTTF